MAQPVDFFVDLAVFFDKRVGAGNVGFRLVIIKVTDEIMDGVVRKEILELAVQLRRQRFVVAEDERRFLHFFDDIRHRETSYRSQSRRAAFGAAIPH